MGKSSSLIYHYRNCRVKSIPLETLYTSLELADIPKENLQYSVIRTYSAEEERRNILNEGREIHKDRLMKIKEGIPSLTSLYDGCALNVERWFLVYQKLIDFGTRQFQSLKFNENKIELHYTCYSKGKKKAFTQYLPKKIEVNEEFQYFFGLWCGDRLGKGRMGVANKDKLINFFTRDYLMKLYQKDVEFVLMYNEGIPLPKIDYATQVVCNSAKTNIKGYCINVGIKNSILFQFFDYLKQNLDEFLSSLPSRNFFFAGLFDAEGNIFLEDVCVRWACIEKKMLSILIKHFKEEGIFKRYDGYSVVSYNLTYFEDKIYPHLKHSHKKNKAELLLFGEGVLERRFRKILELLQEGVETPRELAKCLKRVKVYEPLRFLEKAQYIRKEKYPMKFFITSKGLEHLQRGEGL